MISKKEYAKYRAYLLSPEWQEKRLIRLEKANYRCERCKERDGLEVHHKTYERLYHERIDDLIVLCKSCHWAADEERRGNNELKSKFYAPIPESKRAALRNKKQYNKTRNHKKKNKKDAPTLGSILLPRWLRKKNS